jgi:hypothetical protein
MALLVLPDYNVLLNTFFTRLVVDMVLPHMPKLSLGFVMFLFHAIMLDVTDTCPELSLKLFMCIHSTY